MNPIYSCNLHLFHPRFFGPYQVPIDPIDVSRLMKRLRAVNMSFADAVLAAELGAARRWTDELLQAEPRAGTEYMLVKLPGGTRARGHRADARVPRAPRR
jgi:hypothetical protein